MRSWLGHAGDSAGAILAIDADAALTPRIWLRSSSVALGYWQRSQAQADGFHDGWYCPGDMFLRCPDGRLEFAGRNDDMLKISGAGSAHCGWSRRLASQPGPACCN